MKELEEIYFGGKFIQEIECNNYFTHEDRMAIKARCTALLDKAILHMGKRITPVEDIFSRLSLLSPKTVLNQMENVPENPTCMDLQECAKGLEAAKKIDSLSDSDKKNFCKILHKKLECMEKATKKCMEMTLSEETKKSLRSGVLKGKEFYKKNCLEGDGVGATEFSWLLLAAGLLTTWQLQQQL
ncbi:hypothetical protein PoB_000986400 [Plakobranchus ocellatus]|uniref:Uncharacterized protein n=1 Tax=Plakobranchus ocellatus TaxID=259542 RepID=A0AAV3YMM9_9GAST|nr:hypothetical protein PoB_000986400 [Plakobranchus ocellatus]